VGVAFWEVGADGIAGSAARLFIVRLREPNETNMIEIDSRNAKQSRKLSKSSERFRSLDLSYLFSYN
jgi:hypothetical protein